MDNLVDEINIVSQILRKFEEGYIKRDITTVDPFMDELFIKSENTTILGTSNGEMCIGFEASKELIKSDWEYWGDVRLDTDNPVVRKLDNAIWFAVHGTVKYTFRTNEDVWGRYVSFVENCLKTAEKGLKEGLTHMNWGLSHLLFPRTPEERNYLWPMRLTGALMQEDGIWKFHYMQFSLPCSVFPDMKMGTEVLDHMYENPPFAVESFKQGHNASEIKSVMSEFSKAFSCKSEASSLEYFSRNKDVFFVGPQEPWYIGHDSISEGLGAIHDKWGHMELDLDHAIVYDDSDSAWIVCGGNMHKVMEEDEVLKEQVDNIKNIISSPMHPKEKLFHIQRNTLASFKEIASGNKYNWPCRLETSLTKEGTNWLINSMQLSYPFYYILEDKLDGIKL